VPFKQTAPIGGLANVLEPFADNPHQPSLHRRRLQCIYECVWAKADNGFWVCCFALQIYNWKELGSEDHPQRGCVGLYIPVSGCPSLGTKGMTIEIPYSNLDPLDAFGM
jgi:hypothetical protein